MLKAADLTLGEANAAAVSGDDNCGAPAAHAFAGFFRNEWPKLRNYLRRFVTGEDAEDLAQEAFVRVYNMQGPVRSPTGLLYQTARNLVIDRRRHAAVSARVMVDGALVGAAPDSAPSPEEQVEQRLRLERALAMLEKLSPKCRSIFLMQVLDGCSYAEIATRMGLSVVAVKKQLLRAFEMCAAHAAVDDGARARRGAAPKRGSKPGAKKVR